MNLMLERVIAQFPGPDMRSEVHHSHKHASFSMFRRFMSLLNMSLLNIKYFKALSLLPSLSTGGAPVLLVRRFLEIQHSVNQVCEHRCLSSLTLTTYMKEDEELSAEHFLSVG